MPSWAVIVAVHCAEPSVGSRATPDDDLQYRFTDDPVALCQDHGRRWRRRGGRPWKDDQINRTKLLIIIRPRVVRDGENPRRATDEYRSRIKWEAPRSQMGTVEDRA